MLLDLEIDYDIFRLYSEFRQLLGPIVQFGAVGVLDGLVAFFPRRVVRLFSLLEQAESDAH